MYTLNEYWKLFERIAEMFVYVDCPLLVSMEIPEDQALVGSFVRNAIVDVYFHDV